VIHVSSGTTWTFESMNIISIDASPVIDIICTLHYLELFLIDKQSLGSIFFIRISSIDRILTSSVFEYRIIWTITNVFRYVRGDINLTWADSDKMKFGMSLRKLIDIFEYCSMNLIDMKPSFVRRVSLLDQPVGSFRS